MAELTKQERLVAEALIADFKAKKISTDKILQSQFFKALSVEKKQEFLRLYSKDISQGIRVDSIDNSHLFKKAIPDTIGAGLSIASAVAGAKMKAAPPTLRAAMMSMPLVWWYGNGIKGINIYGNAKKTFGAINSLSSRKDSFREIGENPDSEHSSNLILKKVVNNVGL